MVFFEIEDCWFYSIPIFITGVSVHFLTHSKIIITLYEFCMMTNDLIILHMHCGQVISAEDNNNVDKSLFNKNCNYHI